MAQILVRSPQAGLGYWVEFQKRNEGGQTKGEVRGGRAPSQERASGHVIALWSSYPPQVSRLPMGEAPRHEALVAA